MIPSFASHRVAPRACASIAAFVILVAWLLPVSSRAVDEEDEMRRFVPSFSLSFDAIGQRVEASITSTPVLGDPIPQGGCLVTSSPFLPPTRNGSVCPNSPVLLQPNRNGNDTNALPMVGASLELMTPSLLDAWLHPRLFGHVDVAAAFGFERNITGVGKPGEDMVIPPLPPQSMNTTSEIITGQGSRAKIQTRRWVVSGGAGIAFTTHVMARTLRIKPSFEVIREEVDLIGAVHRAVGLRWPGGLTLADYRLIRFSATSKETLWGVGPGLEIEIDTVPTGPIMMSVFLQGRGYRFVGDLDYALTTSNQFGESSTFDFEFDPWLWRGGVGLRFRWIR